MSRHCIRDGSPFALRIRDRPKRAPGVPLWSRTGASNTPLDSRCRLIGLPEAFCSCRNSASDCFLRKKGLRFRNGQCEKRGNKQSQCENPAFGFCIIFSILRYRHNARWECTTISGDHLGKKMRNYPHREAMVALALDGPIQPNASERAGPLGGGRPMVSIFEFGLDKVVATANGAGRVALCCGVRRRDRQAPRTSNA